MLASLAACILLVLILILPPARFGDFQAVLKNLRPEMIWLLALSLQSFFFAFVWHSLHFIEKPQGGLPPIEVREMLGVLAIFAFSLALKIVFVLPNGYGMLKDVGETKYLYMLQYFNEGIFLHSATEFTTQYPPLYPLALMFAYSLRGFAFEGMKLINAFMASSLVFPVYFLSRRFLDRKAGLLLIALCSLIPFQFLMPVRLLSENLYLPLLLAVIYLVFVRPADDRYRFAWDCLTGFALGLLYLTRYISLALIPFMLLVWWVKPFRGAGRVLALYPRKLRNLLAMLAVAALTYLPWILVGVANDLPLTQMLGFSIAADTNPAQLTLANLLKWFLFYGGYYILLAAPVLNLLLVRGRSEEKNMLEGERNRWALMIGVLMLAFGVAIVRHSWRADYNLDLPKRLMGRYVIYFVPLFLMSAFMAFKRFDKSRYSNLGTFFLLNELLPLALVLISYQLVIKGALIPVNAEFIHPLISIDGYYLELLGNGFFVLLAVLYTGTNLLLWYGRRELAVFAAVGLAVFYLLGEPAYQELMVSGQTPQQMGKLALDLMRAANRKAGQNLKYEVLLPAGLSGDEMDDAAWTIFIRNPQSEWRVGSYAPQKVLDLKENASILIVPLADAGRLPAGDYQSVYINGQPYAAQVILPE